MTLVKSLYSSDPDVFQNTPNQQGVSQATSHPPSKCYLAYILVQFMCVHVCSCNTCTGGSQVAGLICRCSLQPLTSCLVGFFLKYLLPTRKAQVRFPAGTCQSWDLQIRIEMTLVKCLYEAYSGVGGGGEVCPSPLITIPTHNNTQTAASKLLYLFFYMELILNSDPVSYIKRTWTGRIMFT